ncbi:MAG: VWA domain-containing protein [Clostridia bacterium]|nr:VWA domain-containing protein [Clostridia bacterium]
MKVGKKGIIIAIVSTIVIIGIIVCIIFSLTGAPIISKIVNPGGGDDWLYKPGKSGKYGNSSGLVYSSTATDALSEAMSSAGSASSKSNTGSYLGYTVGGASNTDSFRQNIKNGYLPLSTDITYNGLYSEYYFDTGDRAKKSDEMFYPSYSFAVSTNPLSKEQEYYMSIGLNSNIKESDFQRNKVNLVIVLDISGSMSSSFNSYYYDKKDKSDNKSKMKIAEECVNNLIDKLNPDDRFGIVLFDDQGYIGKKISTVKDTDLEKIKNHILEVEPMGGTNFSSGYELGTELFEGYLEDESYQNRIVVITDAMPNRGDISSDGLTGKIEKNAEKKIYTSLVGVGVDFNTELTEKLSDVRGSNYYSVHSSDEFNKILAENFDYMITPLIYDLDLYVNSEQFEIENVYGSDSVNKTSGNIMHINTLFPSPSNSDGDVKGGIVVLKLKKIKDVENADISIRIAYKDVKENKHENTEKAEFKVKSGDYYDNLGIRKAIVLARYVNALKNWTLFEKSKLDQFKIQLDGCVAEFTCDNDYIVNVLGIHERKSEKLVVSDNYKELFRNLKKYIQDEKNELKDDSLKNEIEILDLLV